RNYNESTELDTVTSFLLDVCFTPYIFFFFQAEDGIRDKLVTGVQTCALPIYLLGDARDPGHEPPHHGDARGARDRNPHPRAGGSGEDHGPRRALGTTGRQSMPQALAQRTVDARSARRARGFPPEASILLVLIGLALTFELLGWILV